MLSIDNFVAVLPEASPHANRYISASSATTVLIVVAIVLWDFVGNIDWNILACGKRKDSEHKCNKKGTLFTNIQ